MPGPDPTRLSGPGPERSPGRRGRAAGRDGRAAGRYGQALRVAAAVLLTGVAAGLGGIALTVLLHAVEHLAFGVPSDPSRLTLAEAGADRASPLRRVLSLTAAGLAVGTGWAVLRRLAPPVSVGSAVARAPHRMPFLRTAVDAVLQVVAVGAGASLGREGAPRQVGAAAGAALGGWWRTAALDRAALVAVGAGAGLAAVYDVPLSGALFAVEIVLPSRDARRALAALGASGVAAGLTATVLGSGPVYAVAPGAVSGQLVVAALVLAPVAGVVAAGFSRLAAAARRSPARGWRTVPAVTVTFAALGLLGWPFPELLGNGQGQAQLAFGAAAHAGAGTLLALVVLKPLATAACLRSGAVGGLLTPAIATGSALGALAAAVLAPLLPGTDRAAVALVGAAAVLAATQRAPVTAVALVLELTGTGLGLGVPVVLAVAGASLVDRALAPPVRVVGTGPAADADRGEAAEPTLGR